MRKSTFLGLAFVATAAATVPASAAVSIVGGGLGRDCFLAAELKRLRRENEILKRAAAFSPRREVDEI